MVRLRTGAGSDARVPLRNPRASGTHVTDGAMVPSHSLYQLGEGSCPFLTPSESAFRFSVELRHLWEPASYCYRFQWWPSYIVSQLSDLRAGRLPLEQLFGLRGGTVNFFCCCPSCIAHQLGALRAAGKVPVTQTFLSSSDRSKQVSFGTGTFPRPMCRS